MRFVEVKNGRLYYDDQGAGPPLVMIHGAWASHQWWRWQLPELAQHYRVVVPDLRGHGYSTPLESAYSVEGFAQDLEILRQAAGIDEAALIGWSLGGYIALQYSLTYPAKVNGLVLIAAAGHRNPKLKLRSRLIYLQARLLLMLALSQPRRYDRRAQCFPSLGHASINRQVKKMLSPAASAEVYDWVRADLEQNPRNSFFEVLKSFWDWEAGDRLGQISVPTLIMVGEHDTWTPPDLSRRMHRAISASKLIIIKNAGHCLPLEQSQMVNREILHFLREIGY